MFVVQFFLTLMWSNYFLPYNNRYTNAAKFCDPCGTRTHDPNIKSVVLYQLS